MSEAVRLDGEQSASGDAAAVLNPEALSERARSTSPDQGLALWLTDAALPLWVEAGHCPKTLICEEALGFEGQSAGLSFTRLRVQARQLYVYSRAALAGCGPVYATRAAEIFDGLIRHGWREPGGFVHTLARGGGPRNDTRDLYDHAFVLFALSWYHRASGDPQALIWADKVQDFLDAALRPADGKGYLETPKGHLPRRQNPHMHLFEAYLALFEATGDERWLGGAAEMLGLFLCHVWDRRTGLINEFFEADWSVRTPQGRPPFEPGHHFEWAWLLSEYQRLSGEDLSFVIRRVFNTALNLGRCAETGFAMDYMDRTGPAGDSRRLWPQAELIRALNLFRPAEAEIMEERLRSHYLNTGKPGLWFDRMADGENVARHVPASTLYHLVGIAWD